MKWVNAPDVKKRLIFLLDFLEMPHVLGHRLIAFRSYGSTGRAIARIWSLPTVWQQALKVKPHYVIEVIAERFDRLSEEDRDRTLIHELMHIPKTFSGALVPHRGRGHGINHKTVERKYQDYLTQKGRPV